MAEENKTERTKEQKDDQKGHHVTHLHACVLSATQVSVRLAPASTGFPRLANKAN